MCVDKYLSINLRFLGCVVGAGLLDECNWAPFTCYISSSLHRMPSCLKGSFFTVFSAFSEGLGKNAKVQLKLSHHQRPTHSGNESCGGDGGCEKFLGRVSVWAQPPAAESQENHPQVPRLVSGDAAVSDRGRQDSLDPGKFGLESNIHSSIQSPSGDSPKNGGPWPVHPPAFGASAQWLGALALGEPHITSLDPQRLSFQQEGNQSGCRELVLLSLNQDARSFEEKVNKGLVTRAQAIEMQNSLQARQNELLQYRDQKVSELSEEERVMMNQIHHSIIEYLKEFNKDYKYKMIISTSNGSPILNADPKYNVTSEVLRGLNEKYKAQEAAAKK